MGMVMVFLYVAALYVRPQDWAPGLVGLPTAFIILPLALLCGMVNRLREPEHFRAPQTYLLAIYLAIIFVSTLLSAGIGTAWAETDLFARRIVVFYIVIWILITPVRVEATIWMVLLMSLFLSYQAYLQATTGTSWGGLTPFPGYEVVRVRWYGDWDGPNVLALLFVISLAFAIEYVFGPHAFVVRAASLGLAGFMMMAVFYTNSRGAVLAIACMVLFYFRERFKSKFAIILAVSAVLAVLLLGPSRMSEVNSSEASARERTWLWEQGLNLLKANPVFGIGRDQFWKSVDLKLIAHNNFVQNFAEMGLVGFFCFMSILWFSFKGNQMLAEQRYPLPPRIRALGRMMTTALVGYCATTFFVVMELDLFFFVLGLCAATHLVARRSCPEMPAMTFGKTDLAIVLAAMTAMLVMIWLAAVKHIL
ncbi:MAG: O-antigen ligase family protein [Betaproteobacteria bacterium]|nr:O-antigen ligase family protein [Betaproteobacteria bacterium]